MISVIIPTYNRESTIKRSVQSVLNQTYRDIEIIVVDDGSSDSTYAILESIHDTRLRYEKVDHNRGACAARNHGIELAKGDYISFQDSDDVWLPNKLERQFTMLIESEADIIFCTMQVHFANSTETCLIPNESQPMGFIDYYTLLVESIVSTQTILAKRECFDAIRFDELMPRLQDWDLILRLSQSYSVYYQNEILVDVYFQSDSISMNPTKGVDAIRRIMQKHKVSIDTNSELKAIFWNELGNYLLMDGKNPTKAYATAFYSKPSLRKFVKLMLSSFGLIRIIYHRRKMVG